MLIYHAEVSLAEGFEILDKPKEERLLRGKRVSACSGWRLFKTLRGQPIRCWQCGGEADRWVADKGRFDLNGWPVLNLYGVCEGKLVMINRDHIIPKSLGGIDVVENLRPACFVCNHGRGNQLTEEDLEFCKANPHLISTARLEKGKKKVNAALALSHSPEHKDSLIRPFQAIEKL